MKVEYHLRFSQIVCSCNGWSVFRNECNLSRVVSFATRKIPINYSRWFTPTVLTRQELHCRIYSLALSTLIACKQSTKYNSIAGLNVTNKMYESVNTILNNKVVLMLYHISFVFESIGHQFLPLGSKLCKQILSNFYTHMINNSYPPVTALYRWDCPKILLYT